MFNIKENLENFIKYIEAKNDSELKEELDNLHSADLAEFFENITPEEREKYFSLLNAEKSAEVIEEVNPQLQVELLSNIKEEKAFQIIQNLPHDSAADFLGEMSDVETENYLNKLPHRLSLQIRELLSYQEDTAGGIMNPEVLTVDRDMTIQEALSFIRIKAEGGRIELYYLYVIDRNNLLLGVISLRDLITSPPYLKIEEIMTSEIIKVNVDDDQEKVSDILLKYGFLAIPVVDKYGKLKGIVTWDDAQEVAEEETTEEIYASSGITTTIIDEDEILTGHILNAIRARTPWLFVTLIGEFIAVNVAHHFNHTLDALPIIAIFMPLLAGLGGNIGTQSITLMVRGLSTGQLNLNSAYNNVFRELKVGLSIGVFFGILVSLFTWGWHHNFALGAVVGVAMATNMTLATILGTIIPFVLKKNNIDPAIASGPFIATTIDVLGLAVYFSLVTAFLKYLI